MTTTTTARRRTRRTLTALLAPLAACVVLMCGASTASAYTDWQGWNDDNTYYQWHDTDAGWFAETADATWVYSYSGGIWLHMQGQWDGWIWNNGSWLFYDQSSANLWAWNESQNRWVNYNEYRAASTPSATAQANQAAVDMMMANFNQRLVDIWLN